VKEQIVLAQLFGKGVVLEKTVTLDGPKSGPYHVVRDEKDYAIVWGPFTEKKMIQVALYWNNPHNSALEPIGKGGLKEVRSSFIFSWRIIESASVTFYSSPTTSFASK